MTGRLLRVVYEFDLFPVFVGAFAATRYFAWRWWG